MVVAVVLLSAIATERSSRFLFLFTLSYLTVSGIAWVRRNLLWSLRNQIAACHVVIAIVPLLLLLAMCAGLARTCSIGNSVPISCTPICRLACSASLR